MKSVFILSGLECANCTSKMEEAINKIEGISSVSISFITRKLVLEHNENDIENILTQIKKIIKKIEPDVKVEKQ